MSAEEKERRERLVSFIEEGMELLDEAEPLVVELEARAVREGVAATGRERNSRRLGGRISRPAADLAPCAPETQAPRFRTG